MSAANISIIGAGPGGLAAAIQLAHAGAKVTLFESRERVGGRCSAIEAEGFRFDVGPTFFLYPRILQEIFQSVGRDLWREVPMRRLDPQYRITFGEGGKLDATPDLARMCQEIEQLSPGDSAGLERYLNDNRTKLKKFQPVLESPFNSWVDLLRPSTLASLPYLHPMKSLGKQLEQYFRDPRLIIAFTFQAKYLGMSPFRCPSLFSILSFLEYEHGVYHPIGGCNRVSERMAEIAVEMGVDLRLNEPVKGLDFDGRRAVGVRTAKGDYKIDSLVINADFGNAMEKLVPDRIRRRWTDKKLEKKKYSCSTFMMYLGVEGTFPSLAHHNIHISNDYKRNLQQIEETFELPDEPSFYVQNASMTDPTLAPPGHSAIYILVPVPHLRSDFEWTPEVTAKFRSRVFKELKNIGLDDLQSRIRYEKVITPSDWRDDYQVYRGATFNLAHSLDQMLHLRPHNRFEDLESVYLVGGGTHPGSGLPVIYESSRITCKELLGDLDMSSDFISKPAPQTVAAPVGLPA